MLYNAKDIARYIIKYERDNNRFVDNVRLQQLLYFVQAAFLVQKDDVCFVDRMEAFDFGPAVLSVWRSYVFYGTTTLTILPDRALELKSIILPEDKNIIDFMLTSCANISSITLGNVIARQDPWINANNSVDKAITPEAMRQYFQSDD